MNELNGFDLFRVLLNYFGFEQIEVGNLDLDSKIDTGARLFKTAMRGVKTELVRLTQESNALKYELSTLKDSRGSTPGSTTPIDAEYGAILP
jgi:hypothetical protein